MHRILDRRIQFETELRRELEVLEPAPELVADEPAGRHEPGHRLPLLLRVSEHADSYARLSEVRRHANRRDAHEPDPRVLELAPNDGHDLLANLLPDLIRAVAGHDDLRTQRVIKFLLVRDGMSPSCLRARMPRTPRRRCRIPARQASRVRLP